MKNLNELRKMLYDIDGRAYKAYKSLEGIYEFNNYKFEYIIVNCKIDYSKYR